MSKLPAGVHFVCVVALDVKTPRSGGSNYLAVSLYAISGLHAGSTFVDRLLLWSTNPQAARIANEKYASYCKAACVEAASLQDTNALYFRPLCVKIGSDKKSDQLKVAKLDAIPTGFRPEAEALCKRLREVGAIFTSDGENEQAGAAGADSEANSDELVIHAVSSVQAVPIRWLWPQRFAIGKVSIVAGDPGLGKSQFTAFMAAVVTTGGTWPNYEGQAEQGDVVMLSCEDDLADTIRPRLEAAGADLTRVLVISAVAGGDGKRRGFNLTDDVTKLETVLQRLGGRARLVIIDPITAYMGRKIDSDKATEVRDVLNPVQDLAARYGVAVVCVSHPPKGATGGKAVNAVIGSQAYVAATRATWIVTKDEDNEERRLMLQVKNNLGNAKGLAFRVQTRSVPTGYAPYIEFEHGYVETTADEALGGKAEPTLGRSQMDKAKAFLQRELAAGPLDNRVLMQRAEIMGVSERTMQRAAQQIGVLKGKVGFDGGWTWGFAISPVAVDALFAPLGLPPLNRN